MFDSRMTQVGLLGADMALVDIGEWIDRFGDAFLESESTSDFEVKMQALPAESTDRVGCMARTSSATGRRCGLRPDESFAARDLAARMAPVLTPQAQPA